MEQSKKFKAKYFNADMEAIRNSLYEATKEENVITLLQEDERNTRIKLVKQDDDRFFITINREKITGIPVRYNEEDIACIDVPAGYHLGELYYAIIDKDIIVGVSGLGVSLQKSIEEALYRLTDTVNRISITPELDVDMYEEFKKALHIRYVDFKLDFPNRDAVNEFINTPAGSNFSHWFDYNNLLLDMKLTGRRNFPLDKEIYNFVDSISGKSYCKKLKVKFLNRDEETIETNLFTPKTEFAEYISFEDYLDDSIAFSFLKRALDIR